MKRDTLVQLIAGVVLLVCLSASVALSVGLSSSSGRHRLTYTDVAEEGQPPEVSLGIAMGAFRGLFVNMLWIRANNLKEEGRFYESMDLARIITRLQPRYPQVWVFHAWNMAYNISVQTHTNSERWLWVKAGINLLRDHGLRANPNDLLIHKELGWIFLHKIGGYMDEANLYYKKQLALEWSFLLGPPPPPDPRNRDRRALTDKFVEWFRPVAEAPDTLEEVIAREPSVQSLLDRLKADLDWGPDGRVVQNYPAIRVIAEAGQRQLYERGLKPTQATFLAITDDPTYQKAWPALLSFLRKRIIIEQYGMEPSRMLRYMEMYGPIDWRHFAAHGLYWAQRGVENALERVTKANKQDFDFINAGRVAVQSLQELWRSGDLWFDFRAYVMTGNDQAVVYRGAPCFAFVDSYAEHLEWFKSLSWADNPRRVYSFYAAGYDNLMKDSIRFLYRRGQIAEANKRKVQLAEWVGQNTNDPDRNIRLALPMEDYIREELKDEELKRPSVMREEIVGALQGAFANGLLAGDDEAFFESVKYARWVHEYFTKTQGVQTLVSRADQGRMVQWFRDFNFGVGQEFAAFVSILELDDAQRVYANAPQTLQLYAFDTLSDMFRQRLDDLAKAGLSKSFEALFPPPPGLEEHRIRVRRLQLQESRPEVERK
ncbi:MAG: hypothetical protein KF678_04940 [Phycisphaeraceae bacterium]|nr:hypothetical protein [Phycisphaeraceae bacterium]